MFGCMLNTEKVDGSNCDYNPFVKEAIFERIWKMYCLEQLFQLICKVQAVVGIAAATIRADEWISDISCFLSTD